MSAVALAALSPADIPDNVALSRSAGWKDVESEWRVLHAAGDVRGLRRDGRLVAQGVLGDYGNSATLAKMVVAKSEQRQGIGAQLLDEFLEQADGRGIPIGLCATEQGRSLYASRGFRVSGELVILFGAPLPEATAATSAAPLDDVEAALRLDAELSGCDRNRMLRARFLEAEVKVQLTGEPGFALASAQGDHVVLGPVLAETERGARTLTEACFAALAPGRALRVDVPAEQVAFRSWLVQRGLAEMSQRVQMSRGAERMPWQVPARFALALQAWG